MQEFYEWATGSFISIELMKKIKINSFKKKITISFGLFLKQTHTLKKIFVGYTIDR